MNDIDYSKHTHIFIISPIFSSMFNTQCSNCTDDTER